VTTTSFLGLLGVTTTGLLGSTTSTFRGFCYNGLFRNGSFFSYRLFGTTHGFLDGFYDFLTTDLLDGLEGFLGDLARTTGTLAALTTTGEGERREDESTTLYRGCLGGITFGGYNDRSSSFRGHFCFML
jgi:hypothetical protein